MDISTNQKPTIYRNLYENTAPDSCIVYSQLIKHGYTNIDALDMNTAMLEEAKKKGVYINLIQGRLGSNKLDILDSEKYYITFAKPSEVFIFKTVTHVMFCKAKLKGGICLLVK